MTLTACAYVYACENMFQGEQNAKYIGEFCVVYYIQCSLCLSTQHKFHNIPCKLCVLMERTCAIHSHQSVGQAISRISNASFVRSSIKQEQKGCFFYCLEVANLASKVAVGEPGEFSGSLPKLFFRYRRCLLLRRRVQSGLY